MIAHVRSFKPNEQIRLLIICCCLTLPVLLKAQGSLNWEFETKGAVYSTPLLDENYLYIGSADHNFYALDKETGEKLWEFQTKGEIHSSACLKGDLIFFASGDGNLYVVDKNSGKDVWQFKSNGEKTYDLWDYYLSSPKVDGALVYWGSGDGNVYAIEIATGIMKWQFETKGIVHADPVIHKDKIFIGSYDGNLYALDKKSGELIWKFKTLGAQYFPKGEIQKAVLVDNGTVFFGSRDYNLYALDEQTGTVKWNMREPQGWIIATPVANKDHIFFGTSDAHKFYCYEKNSGAKVWDINVGMRVYGSAALYNDLVYFGAFDGKVLGVDSKTGEQKWAYQTKGSIKNYATVFDANGQFKKGFALYGNDMIDTEKMILNLGAVLGTPIIDQNTIYFGSADGFIYAVDLNP